MQFQCCYDVTKCILNFMNERLLSWQLKFHKNNSLYYILSDVKFIAGARTVWISCFALHIQAISHNVGKQLFSSGNFLLNFHQNFLTIYHVQWMGQCQEDLVLFHLNWQWIEHVWSTASLMKYLNSSVIFTDNSQYVFIEMTQNLVFS